VASFNILNLTKEEQEPVRSIADQGAVRHSGDILQIAHRLSLDVKEVRSVYHGSYYDMEASKN
jgi:hypothetical protein